ncbi:MAG: ATP-binding protein [Spirochaetes bacterium]|nr:ATP-binding protein [Spirochaetota bacterium]
MINSEVDESVGYIRLSFGPKWKYVACVRGFVQNFLSISISDAQKADKISLAVSELVENAVKYNSREKTSLLILIIDDNNILIESQNYAKEENIKIFVEELEKIKSKDPKDAYIEKMKEVIDKSGKASQLGLARIRCETNCELKYEITDNELLKIVAIFH